jgi:catechol 2,3-dioxygenase-like lactoylglutathione lyase family enzyme
MGERRCDDKLALFGIIGDPRQRIAAHGNSAAEIPSAAFRCHPDAYSRTRLGFHHICFAVDDIEAEIDRLCANGATLVNHVMDFHDRKLVFLAGPEGIVVELSQWHGAS